MQVQYCRGGRFIAAPEGFLYTLIKRESPPAPNVSCTRMHTAASASSRAARTSWSGMPPRASTTRAAPGAKGGAGAGGGLGADGGGGGGGLGTVAHAVEDHTSTWSKAQPEPQHVPRSISSDEQSRLPRAAHSRFASAKVADAPSKLPPCTPPIICSP